MSFAAVFIVLLSPSALAGAFITNDQCKQSDEFLWNRRVNTSVDCGCPPDFVALSIANKTEICVLLSKARPWAGNLCQEAGTGDDYYELAVGERTELNDLLKKVSVMEFWISVQRDGVYGPPRKKLPGVDWGKPLNMIDDYDVELQHSTGECLLIDIKLNYSRARFDDCNNSYPQLCIYKAKESLLPLYCDESAELTTRYSRYQDTCFRIEPTQIINSNSSLYDVDSQRKFQLFHDLHHRSKLRCEYTAVQSAFSTKLQAFATVTRRINESSSVVIPNDGIMELADSFNCVAYQNQTFNFPTPQLTLNFDRVHLRLLLTIINGRFLFRDHPANPGVTCFTDADTDLLKKVKIKRKLWPPPSRQQPDSEETQEIYELKMQGDFPGQYWCEGHAVPKFSLIQSERITAQKKDSDVHIYAVQIRLNALDREDFLQKKYLKQLVQNFEEYLDQFEDVRSIVKLLKRMQVMRVEEIDRLRNKLTVLLHVAVKNKEPRDMDDSSDEEDDEDVMGALQDDIRKHYRLKYALTVMFTRTSSAEYTFLGINSTDVCLPERFDTDGFTWPAAPIGHTVTPHHHLCLVESTGLPLRRKCIGDRTYGGVWQRLEGDPERCSQAVGAQTLALFKFHSNLSGQIENVLGEIERVMDDPAVRMIPADVFYLSATVENIRTTLFGNDSSEIVTVGNKTNSYYCGLAGILSRVMDVDASIVFRSQAALNTTNILLDSADAIINQLSVANGSADFLNSGSSLSCHARDSLEAPRNGTMVFRTGKLILLVADPLIDDISGIALIRRNDTEHSNFDSYDTRLLTVDESEQDVIVLENLEIAAFIPRSLLEKIDQLQSGMYENLNLTSDPLRVVISIYFNDHIFRETTNGTISRANSKIISVTIPGYGSDLPGELPIFLREADTNQSSVCGFWDFEPNGDGVEESKWSFRGCTLAEQIDDVALCKCSHLTSFSRLCSDVQIVENVSVYQVFVGQQNNMVLTVISAIGCALSLLGVAMIFVTAIIFPSWRTTANANILLQLSFAIAFEMIIFTMDGPDIDYSRPDTKIGCTLLGASFHYIILVTFMWMLVIAYLQFMRFVKVLGRLRPSHCILKASIISWGLPLVPVMIFSSYDNTLYHKRDNISDICYPHGIALTYGLLLPIGLVLIANVASFALIVYNVFRIPDNLTRSLDKSMTLSQLRLSMFLFFLLGLPWIFGMMVAVGAGSIFSYLFCLTAPLQGFIMFVYFILMEPTTRRLWLNKFAEMVGEKPNKKNTFNESIKTTTLN